MAKVSEITLADIKNAIRIDDDSDDIFITHIMDAAKGYIRDYTALSDEEIDSIPQMAAAFYCLCSDMYDVREMAVQRDKINPTVRHILLSHARNYL